MARPNLERLKRAGYLGVWGVALVATIELVATVFMPTGPLRIVIAIGGLAIVVLSAWPRRSVRAERYTAIFNDHPDAIAVYNLDGTIRRSNPASTTTFGINARFVGESWRKHVVEREWNEIDRHFQYACSGEAAKCETYFTRGKDEIPVEWYLVPTVVDGLVVSIVGTARDLRRMREAQELARVHVERLSSLAEIKSDFAAHPQHQVRRLLEYACSTLGMEEAAVSTIAEHILTVTHSISPRVKVGTQLDMAITFARHLYGSREPLGIENTTREPWCNDPAVLSQQWQAYIGATIFVEGRPFGILSFTRRSPREHAFEKADYDFVRMAGALIGAALERTRNEERLAAIANNDPITGLLNRTAFDDHLRMAIARAGRHGGHVRVHYIDLDGFKPVNDTLGHSSGDEALRIFATRLRSLVRTDDIVARVGGDEFVILESTLADESDSTALGDRVVAAASELMYIGTRIVRIGASVGVATYPRDARNEEELLQRADAAMYSAKSTGKGSVKLYSYG